MIAIVSDIHSNHLALEAVLEDIQKRGCREIICLGDVIGYGPRPRQCLKIARREFSVTLCGNHERAIFDGPAGFRPIARDAVDWHRRMLGPRWYSEQEAKEDWAFIRDLPRRHERGKFLFVHASPHNPTEEYLLPNDVDEFTQEPSAKLLRAFDLSEWVTFIGHTHQPGVFTLDPPAFRRPPDLENKTYRLESDQKAIINVGSVGQPRDGDNRACYATLHEGAVVFHRVPYDVAEVCQQVVDTGALHESLGKRLLNGT